jgi:hypothetical protein
VAGGHPDGRTGSRSRHAPLEGVRFLDDPPDGSAWIPLLHPLRTAP